MWQIPLPPPKPSTRSTPRTSPSLVQTLGGYRYPSLVAGPPARHPPASLHSSCSPGRKRRGRGGSRGASLCCSSLRHRAPRLSRVQHAPGCKCCCLESSSLVFTSPTHMLPCCRPWHLPWRSSFILWTQEPFLGFSKSSQASISKVSIGCFLAGLCKSVFDIRSLLGPGCWGGRGRMLRELSPSSFPLAAIFPLKNQSNDPWLWKCFGTVCIWSSRGQ